MTDVIFPNFPKPKEFEKLKLGDLFLNPEAHDYVYIRINELEKGEKTTVNAINLLNGHSCYFEHDDFVFHVEGKLKLNYIEGQDFSF